MRTSIFPGWWQVIVAILVQAASTAAIFTAFSIIAVPLQETFDSSRTLLMMAVTMTILIAGVTSPIIGAAMDKYSLRSLMLAGAGLLVVGFFSLSFTQTMTQAVVVYAVFMATASVLAGPLAASTLLARWFTRRRGLAMGIAASGTALGGLIVPPLLQFMIEAFEWRLAVRLFSALLFVLTVPAIMLLAIDRPSDRKLYPDGDDAPSASAAPSHAGKFSSMQGVLSDPNFWFIAAVIGLIFAGLTALTSNLVPLVLDKGFGADKGALLLSCFSAGNLGGKVLFAGVGDRVEVRWALAAGLIVQSIGVFGFLHADDYLYLLMASLLLGLAAGGILPLWGFLLARSFGAENLGRVMGLMSVVVTAFNLSSPLAFGVIFDRTGSYDRALMLYIVLLMIAMCVVPRIRTRAVPALAGA